MNSAWTGGPIGRDGSDRLGRRHPGYGVQARLHVVIDSMVNVAPDELRYPVVRIEGPPHEANPVEVAHFAGAGVALFEELLAELRG